MPAPHPPEFRRRAVELARLRDKPFKDVAKDLGISESCPRNWMSRADVDEGRHTTHAAVRASDRRAGDVAALADLGAVA